MRRLLLALVLAMGAGVAQAKSLWVEMLDTDGMTVYLHREELQIYGNGIVRMTILKDLKNVKDEGGGRKAYSWIDVIEGHCGRQAIRDITSTAYDMPGGRGRPFETMDCTGFRSFGEWTPKEERPIEWYLVNSVCEFLKSEKTAKPERG